MVTWLITMAAKDQPELLKKFIHTLGMMEAVILASQQTVMGGQSTVMLKVRVPTTHMPFAHQTLSRFHGLGLNIVSIEELPKRVVKNHRDLLVIDVNGPYGFALEQDIRSVLENHGAVIQLMRTDHQESAFQGQPELSVNIHAQLSRPLSEAKLYQALSRLSPALDIDINVLQQDNALAS